MPDLMIRCPTTGKPVNTGIATTKDSFATSTYKDNSVSCPHCGQTHRWSKDDAYLKQDDAQS